MTPARGKLLVYYVDPAEAAAMCRRLRAAGVMVEVDSVDPHNIQPSKSGSQRIGLWVVFDDQFDDAVQLLRNPGHLPQRVISPGEMDSARPVSTQLHRCNRAIVVAAICLLLGLVYFAVF